MPMHSFAIPFSDDDEEPNDPYVTLHKPGVHSAEIRDDELESRMCCSLTRVL